MNIHNKHLPEKACKDTLFSPILLQHSAKKRFDLPLYCACFLVSLPMRIALLREEKLPPDKRVAFTPQQCLAIQQLYPSVQFVVQPSSHRCIPDAVYKEYGIAVNENITDCDLLIGIKEVPKDKLIANKKYLFFSHTVKMQPHNKEMLQQVVRLKITLYDFELFLFPNKSRVIGFGEYAGIVGAYNGLLAWGKRYKTYTLKPAWQCANYNEMLQQLHANSLPDVPIVATGNGRVAAGIIKLLRDAGYKQTDKESFGVVPHQKEFVCLQSKDLYQNINGEKYEKEHFRQHPNVYKSVFLPYAQKAKILCNGVYWDKNIPRLFTVEEASDSAFTIEVIADISCDISGSVPVTIRETDILNPVFGWSKTNKNETKPYSIQDTIDIMSVPNLPSELPFDASEGFGNMLKEYIIPELLNPQSEMINQATICKDGMLMPKFYYLKEYAAI